MFKYPSALLLILLIPALLFWINRRMKESAVFVPVLEGDFPVSWKVRTAFIPSLFVSLGLIALIVSLARPHRPSGQQHTSTEGIAIQMVVDISGSMGISMNIDGTQNRLDIVRDVFSNFALGDGRTLSGRPDDLIGIISFARYADTICPLTLSREILPAYISSLQVVKNEELDGTAVGDALALAASRLYAMDSDEGGGFSDIKSRIIILLTDGQTNYGDYTPEEAAKLAKEWGIRVYAIGFGGGYYRNLFGNVEAIPPGRGLDEKSLKQVAEISGGSYFNADSRSSLVSVYKEIDKLEKTRFETSDSVKFDELYQYSLIAGLFCLILGVLLTRTLYRRLD